MTTRNQQQGFTLIEIMLVVAIIALLTAIAYPSYQNHIRKTKRVDMMTEMQNIASNIEAQKLAKGTYTQVDISSYIGDFPREGTSLYTIAITPNNNGNLDSGDWLITATPYAAGVMAEDGTLTFDNDGVKCRDEDGDKKCGKANQWND